MLFRLISEKVPTAYMVLPHCTSCLICSVVPVGASCGVPVTGVEDTGPVALAAAVEASRDAAAATTPPANTILRPRAASLRWSKERIIFFTQEISLVAVPVRP